jgi:hypothetical protein
MKTLILSGLAFVSVSAVVLAQTANLTGQWKGETKSGTTLELNLTGTSTTLTGTMLRRDEVIKLTDGKVQGKTFTFKSRGRHPGDRPSPASSTWISTCIFCSEPCDACRIVHVIQRGIHC